MINIAVIGAGRIGQVHARAVAAHPKARLVQVCDALEPSAKALAEAYDVSYTTDPGEVFANPEVEAVIIGSPTAFHIDHIVGAVEAGKKVLCEKPIALDVEAARACVAQLGEKADQVMVGFNRRFDPTFAEINSRVSAGEIGDLQQLTVISRDPAAPPASYVAGSGGIFKDMTIHDLDMVQFFLGEIAEISAVGTNADAAIREAGDFDQVMLTLKATSGAMATIINSRSCAYGYDQRLEAFGALGSLSADNLTATSVRKATSDLTEARARVLDFFLERYVDAYTRELSVFIETIDSGAPVTPNLHDGLSALVLAEAAATSAREGRVVKLV